MSERPTSNTSVTSQSTQASSHHTHATQHTHRSQTHTATNDVTRGPTSQGKPKSVFSGPDGMYNHRIVVSRDLYVINDGDNSPEISGDLGYLVRAPPDQAFPKSRSHNVGEIGWGVMG